jgi:hypothetical protein
MRRVLEGKLYLSNGLVHLFASTFLGQSTSRQ